MLARDGRLCRLRLDCCTVLATTAHHVRGKEATGDDPAHMIAACAPCNLRVGDPTRYDPDPRSVTQW